VLSAKESQKVFGVDLADKGVQPVWVKIKNETESRIVFLPIALDPDYFSPHEVSFLNHQKFQGDTNDKMDKDFDDRGIDLETIKPNEDMSGFVFTNLNHGVKLVNIVLSGDQKTERFMFLFEVPGIETNYQTVDFKNLYAEDEIVDFTDQEELRQALKNLPCCTTAEDGSGEGDPINFVIISDPKDLLAAFIKRRWDVTQALSETGEFSSAGEVYSVSGYKTAPMGILYMYGRRQDVGFQKSRQKEGNRLRQRNQVRIWLTPMRYNGKPIWIASVSRDIGSDINRKKYWFVAAEIDPEIDESRDYLTEDITLSLGVSKLGWVTGVGETTPDNPHVNLLEQPWWTDGYRGVVVLEGGQIPLAELQIFPWEDLEEKHTTEYEDKLNRRDSPLEFKERE